MTEKCHSSALCILRQTGTPHGDDAVILFPKKFIDFLEFC